MKKIKILASIMVLICNISCSELDLAPISSMATNSMWNTRDDAIAAKNGMYYLFRNAFADTYQYYGELRTGLYKFGRSFYEQWVPLFDNQLIPSSTGTDWTNFYTLINHCNLILKYVPEIEMLQTDKDKILAEAHFVRAFIYFWLARIWGEVPVITVPFESDNQENLYPVRNPVSTVWQQIKNDLAEAESLYPATEQIQESYYVNIAAIQMLKTDVYLWLYKVENESEALVKAEEGVNAVLGNSSYALEPVFRNIFRKE